MSGDRSGWIVRRRLGRALSIAGAVAVGVGVAGVALHRVREAVAVREAFPVTSGRVPVAGISAPVAIHRDDRGVPHVEAGNEADALFGLGFVHAQDRLAQMVWLRRLAQGRSAEVLGPDGLAADRLARTLDFAGLARAEVAALDDSTRALVEAYARGIDARIVRLRSGLAEAPVALREDSQQLESWQPADSLALLKLYSWGLAASFDTSLVLNDLIERLGGFGAWRFFPRGPSPSGTERTSPVMAQRRRLPWVDPLRAALPLRGRSIGSSAWVVSAAHTKSGSPILVADAHLETTAPSLL
ncbi:MAG: penicillin acylase family protein, partial [Myxococcota bacterium]